MTASRAYKGSDLGINVKLELSEGLIITVNQDRSCLLAPLTFRFHSGSFAHNPPGQRNHMPGMPRTYSDTLPSVFLFAMPYP